MVERSRGRGFALSELQRLLYHLHSYIIVMNIYGGKEHALRAKREETGIFAVNSAFSLSRVARHTPSRRLDLTANLSGIPTI